MRRLSLIHIYTGPANVFLDGWCQRHLGQPYDADGRWAATGQVLAPLLEQLIASEPWFALPPPKSTGRDLFNLRWLDDRLAAYDGPTPAPQDVQATLQRLTARTVANAIDAAGDEMCIRDRPSTCAACGAGSSRRRPAWRGRWRCSAPGGCPPLAQRRPQVGRAATGRAARRRHSLRSLPGSTGPCISRIASTNSPMSSKLL